MPLDQLRAAAAAIPGAMLPVARPKLPPAKALVPYLRQIDANAWYSNHGPLAQAFQARLAAAWGLGTAEVALVSSATAGLTLLLLASGARPGSRCLMPSWTFVASAGAVVAAGLVPHFVDVDPGTWALDPAQVQRLAARHDAGPSLGGSPCGAPLDLAAGDGVPDATGLPVIIDGAAAFDTLCTGRPMPAGRCPIVVSLHATKVFGIGEGGAVLCLDPALMQRVRRLAQFGFLGTREAMLPGVNAKLSEYAAAVGLAGLDGWADTRARWQAVTALYTSLLPEELHLVPNFGEGWVSSTLNILWPDGTPAMDHALASEGIATVRWWGPGCHAQAAFRDYPSEPLPVTQRTASLMLGLPFWQDMPAAKVGHVCRAVRSCLDRRMQAPIRSHALALA